MPAMMLSSEMALLLPIQGSAYKSFSSKFSRGLPRFARPQPWTPLLRPSSSALPPLVCKAKVGGGGDAEKEEAAAAVGALAYVAIAGGLVANPVVAWSLYTLKVTGCGLPPGPGGSLGALEGISYLVVAATIGWSAYSKAKTGSGLPPGPFGLLGAVEGFSYLSLVAIAVVFGLQYLDHGFIPGPVPGEQCFG